MRQIDEVMIWVGSEAQARGEPCVYMSLVKSAGGGMGLGGFGRHGGTTAGDFKGGQGSGLQGGFGSSFAFAFWIPDASLRDATWGREGCGLLRARRVVMPICSDKISAQYNSPFERFHPAS